MILNHGVQFKLALNGSFCKTLKKRPLCERKARITVLCAFNQNVAVGSVQLVLGQNLPDDLAVAGGWAPSCAREEAATLAGGS